MRGVPHKLVPGPVGLACSGGTSSLWPLYAIVNGELARPERFAVFFADTGDEHAWTYEELEKTEALCKAEGIPFFKAMTHRGESISEAVMSAARGERIRVDNPPFWTENPSGDRGQLQQKCTQIWKTRVIRKLQWQWLKSLGLRKEITTWIGFAADEAKRATRAVAKNDVEWARLEFPAIRALKSREAQRADFKRWGLVAPKFSMCVHCPFKTPGRWFETPAAEQRKAFELDEAIRHGLEHVGVREPVFLTDRLVPLESLIRKGDPKPEQLEMFESGCSDGMCFL
jgi:hypothetical protein